MLCQPAPDAQVSARTEALLRARATLRATARLSRLVPAGGDELRRVRAREGARLCSKVGARGAHFEHGYPVFGRLHVHDFGEGYARVYDRQ